MPSGTRERRRRRIFSPISLSGASLSPARHLYIVVPPAPIGPSDEYRGGTVIGSSAFTADAGSGCRQPELVSGQLMGRQVAAVVPTAGSSVNSHKMAVGPGIAREWPFLPKPMPRTPLDGTHPQFHDSLAKVGFLQSR